MFFEDLLYSYLCHNPNKYPFKMILFLKIFYFLFLLDSYYEQQDKRWN